MQPPTTSQAFDELVRPIGTELLAESPPEQLPDRAKVISVLRRVDDLIRYRDPHITNEPVFRRVLDVAAHDVGLRMDEYRRILKHDPELSALEITFHAAVRKMYPCSVPSS